MHNNTMNSTPRYKVSYGLWLVVYEVRATPRERFTHKRVSVVANCSDGAYHEAREDLIESGMEYGFPVSAEPVRVTR
jgi:hypothetical protein